MGIRTALLKNVPEMEKFSEDSYREMLGELFGRFPSFQKSGASAYKPGTDNMEFFDSLLGHPHRRYAVIHVAGTNGKGSVSSMLAAVLASCGLKTGLYTSPHISDFRERMRSIDGRGSGKSAGDAVSGCVRLIPEESVWNFVRQWKETFEHLGLSFFEITTAMAFQWFADEKVDVAVVETGLGGRLDSTNIVSPVLGVITNIGLDHCDLLGETLGEIAFEKAGIIKPRVPAVVGESDPQTDPVFMRKVRYANISDPDFAGDEARMMRLLTFADKVRPSMSSREDEILAGMDLKGEYQRKNLHTVLAAVDVLLESGTLISREDFSEDAAAAALMRTAAATGFRGRWETLCDNPLVIADIGHNPHGLKYNFAQLSGMLGRGECRSLTIVYGAMADKDVDEIMRMLPPAAECIFVTAPGKRAMTAEAIMEAYLAAGGSPARACCIASVRDAVSEALLRSERRSGAGGGCSSAPDLIYVGGSTYVVAETVGLF